MSYVLKVDIAHRSNYGSWRDVSNIDYIVIHYTANDGDTDENNGNYFNGANRKASANYFVDSDSVTQSVPDEYAAYHCGGGLQGSGGHTFFGICKNSNSIGIEICDDVRNGVVYPSAKTIENALELTKSLMKKYNIPPERVIRHYDVTGKICPGYWCGTAEKNNKWKTEFWNKLSNTAKWVQDSTGWWYKEADGSYPKSSWKKINNKWYYFNDRGYALSNEWEKIKDHWYYFNQDCSMKTGWLQYNNNWYYLNPISSKDLPEGAMCVAWQKVNGYWYYFNTHPNSDIPEGAAMKGWLLDDKYTYYLLPEKSNNNPECSMCVRWKKIDNKWYYFNDILTIQPKGSMLQNQFIDYNNKRYYLKSNGEMACNETIEIDNVKYTFNEDGAII